MVRQSLDIYDDRPEGMISYLKYNGWHFNKKALDFAVSKMRKNKLLMSPFTKERVEEILNQSGVALLSNELYDYVYAANLCKAMHWGTSILDDAHLAMYIKDVIDNENSYDGILFSRWYTDMCKMGIPINWDELL